MSLFFFAWVISCFNFISSPLVCLVFLFPPTVCPFPTFFPVRLCYITLNELVPVYLSLFSLFTRRQFVCFSSYCQRPLAFRGPVSHRVSPAVACVLLFFFWFVLVLLFPVFLPSFCFGLLDLGLVHQLLLKLLVFRMSSFWVLFSCNWLDLLTWVRKRSWSS